MKLMSPSAGCISLVLRHRVEGMKPTGTMVVIVSKYSQLKSGEASMASNDEKHIEKLKQFGQYLRTTWADGAKSDWNPQGHLLMILPQLFDCSFSTADSMKRMERFYQVVAAFAESEAAAMEPPIDTGMETQGKIQPLLAGEDLVHKKGWAIVLEPLKSGNFGFSIYRTVGIMPCITKWAQTLKDGLFGAIASVVIQKGDAEALRNREPLPIYLYKDGKLEYTVINLEPLK